MKNLRKMIWNMPFLLNNAVRNTIAAVPAVIACAVLLLSAVAKAAPDEPALRAELEPASVMEGESFILRLSFDGRETPELQELPKGFVYQGNSQSTRIVNGYRTSSVGYQFAAPAPGNYTIAPLKVKLGKSSTQTPELKLQVVKDSAAGAGVEDIMGRIELQSKRKQFFVGEDIPLEVYIYYPAGLRLQCSYPQLEIGKSLFRDYRRINPENPSFAPPRQKRRVLDDKLYEEISFSTAVRPLASGELKISGGIICQILIPVKQQRREFFDDFFGGSSYRKITRQLELTMEPVTIKPLPEIPSDGLFLGLIGDYSVKTGLSASRVTALEPLSLDVYISGSGVMETLRAPEVVIKECRVYPGEIRQNTNGSVISYAVIPLKAGVLDIDLDFLYFDPVKQQYVKSGLHRQLEVAPAVNKPALPPAAAAVPPPVPANNSYDEASAKDVPRTTLLYCKKAPESAFTHLFRRYRMVLAWGLFILGPLFYLASVIIGKIAGMRANDPDSRRRERAAALRGILQEKLRNAAIEELPQLATGEITDYLSDRWKMPAGATPEVIAEQAHDPELAEVLRECAQASYLPAAMAKSAMQDPERVRRVLLRALKCIILVLGIGCFELTGADTPAQSWHEALQAYDKGDYKRAGKYFEEYHRNNQLDANVLYNLGCIAEANGEQEMALYYLESAGLLAPGDSAIHENRNVMRRKFFLPPAGNMDTPVALATAWRDKLHPEDYLLIAALSWLGVFVLISFRKKIAAANYLWWMFSALIVLMIITLTVTFAQKNSTYDPLQALVIAKNAPLFSFPGKHNGQQTDSLPGGTPVKIIEQQGDYVLVRTRDHEGWTEQKNIRKLFNDTSAGVL